MFKITSRWTGVEEFIAKVEKRIPEAQQKLRQFVYEDANNIMTEAKQGVPVDTGTLKSSGFVPLPTETESGGVKIEIGFGGPAGTGNMSGDTNSTPAGYATYVHEDLQAHHTVGHAKFLEIPFRKYAQTFVSRLQTFLSR
jgi:hypothetical protein